MLAKVAVGSTVPLLLPLLPVYHIHRVQTDGYSNILFSQKTRHVPVTHRRAELWCWLTFELTVVAIGQFLLIQQLYVRQLEKSILFKAHLV